MKRRIIFFRNFIFNQTRILFLISLMGVPVLAGYFGDKNDDCAVYSPTGSANTKHFGQKIDSYADWALVSAHGEMLDPNNSGSVYLLKNVNGSWIEADKLSPKSSDFMFGFGGVSLSAKHLAVTSYQKGRNGKISKAIYIYRKTRSDWVFTQLIRLPGYANLSDIHHMSDLTKGQISLESIALDNNFLVVGNWEKSDKNSVLVYQYKKNKKFEKVAELNSAENRDTNNCFGCSVAISGKYLAIGAPLDSSAKTNAGSVYLYKFGKTGWHYSEVLKAPKNTFSFGSSLSLRGNLLGVGAQNSTTMGEKSGAVFVFKKGFRKWRMDSRILAPDGASHDRFGTSIDLKQNLLLVGSSFGDDSGSSSGAAYLFEHDGKWQVRTKIVPQRNSSNNYFGSSVSISRNSYLIGLPGADVDQNSAVGGVCSATLR